MKCFGKILIFLLGIIIGAVGLVGGAGFYAYNLLKQEGSTGQVVDLVGNSLGSLKLEVAEEYRNMSLLDYIKEIGNTVAKLNETEVGKLESMIGLDSVSQLIYDNFGVEQTVIKEATLGGLSEAIADNLTLQGASDKMSIGLPDFPIFKEESFLSQPLNTAFETMDTYNLDRFITVVYAADVVADPTKTESSPMLQKLGQYPLQEISNDFDSILNSMKLEELIAKQDDPSPVMQKLLPMTIGELSDGTSLDDTINAMTLGEMMTIDENSSKILQALKDCSMKTQYDENGNRTRMSIDDALKEKPISELIEVGTSHVWSYLGDKKLDEMGKAIDEMTMGDAVKINDPASPDYDPDQPKSHAVLIKLKDAKVTDLGAELTRAIEDTTIGEMIELKEGEVEPLLWSLRNTKLNATDLNNTIAGLTIKDIFRDYDKGILALVAPETQLDELPSALSLAFGQDASVYKLKLLGILNVTIADSAYLVKSRIYSATPQSMVEDYIALLNNPTAIPPQYELSGGVLTPETLAALIAANPGSGKPGMTIKLTQDTTVSGAFTMPFNVECNGFTLTIEAGTTVAYNAGGYMYVRGNRTGEFSVLGTISVKQGASYVEHPAVWVEYFA